jgi:antitoxin component YwqK of YwqJK toxin-antitoxin module
MSYWSEGQILWHRGYHEGEPHGRSLGWHATGAAERHENFVHGKQQGPSKGWHANGQVFFERHYEGGQRHGLALRHFANGVKSSQGKLEHGKLVGLHESWYESGQIKSHLRHVEGEEYASETWRADGTREAKGNNKGWMKSGEWLYYDTQDRIRLREEYDSNLNLFRRTEYAGGKQVKKQKLVPPMPQVRMH